MVLNSEEIKYKKDWIIYKQGDLVKYIYFIIDGLISLSEKSQIKNRNLIEEFETAPNYTQICNKIGYF